MNLYESITSRISEAEEFDPIEFEKHIPRNMRFKVYKTNEDDSEIPENALYWVTQCPFNRTELEQFQKALNDYTTFDSAYVTLRDLSGYDYLHDKGKDVLAAVGLTGYDANPYIHASKENWPDWDFDGEPYIPIMERKKQSIKEEDTPDDWDALKDGLIGKCEQIKEVLSHYGGVKYIDYSVDNLRIDFQSVDFSADSLSKYDNSIEFSGFIYFDKELNVIKTDIKTASGPNLLNRDFISALNALYTYTHSKDGSYEA